MKVTSDEYELPVAVADTQRELADMVGVDEHVVAISLSRARRGIIQNSSYKEIWIDKEDME